MVHFYHLSLLRTWLRLTIAHSLTFAVYRDCHRWRYAWLWWCYFITNRVLSVGFHRPCPRQPLVHVNRLKPLSPIGTVASALLQRARDDRRWKEISGDPDLPGREQCLISSFHFFHSINNVGQRGCQRLTVARESNKKMYIIK